MKRLLLAVVLLPLVSFGGFDPAFVEYADNPTNILMFKAYVYNSNLSTLSPNVVYGNKDTLPSIVISTVKIGVEVRPLSNVILYHPQGDNESFPSSPSIDYPITRAYNQSRWYCLEYTPDIYQAVNICASLIRSGFRSPRMEIFQDNANNKVICNFRIGDIFSDVLTGTNTFFRSQLLSQLSNVNGSLQSLALSLGTVSADYKTVNNLYLNPSAQSVKDSAASLYTVDGTSSIAANTDRLFGTSRTGRESETAKALAELAREQLKAVVTATLDPSSDFFGQDVTDILNDSDKFPAAVAQGGGGGALGGIARDVKRLSTNDWVSAVTNQLANNRASITNELARNRANITNQLAHMFDDTPNSAGRAIRDTANNTLSAANAAGSIDERLQRGITVAVVNEGNTSVGVHLDGPVNIDSTQWQTLSTPLGSVSSLLDSLYGDFSTFYGFGNSNYDWSHFFDLVQSFKNQNHIDLAAISSHSVTGDVSRIYDYLSGYQSNILYEIATSITNSWDDYYFTRFRRANEFIDESEMAFSISAASDEVFGNGFDEQEFANLNWFSRVELLLYQLQKANETTNVLESADLEGEFDDSVQRFNLAGTNFVAASVRVVNLFGFISRFADSVKLAFQSSASPVTDGVLLMEGGSWLVNEPLVLRVPIAVQNALRLVFQCIWYLSAFVIGWRIVVATWDKVVTLVRWLWSVFDV